MTKWPQGMVLQHPDGRTTVLQYNHRIYSVDVERMRSILLKAKVIATVKIKWK